MIKRLHWRYLVKPEILFLVGAVQANLPYLLWRCGYPIPRAYKFDITYRPLYLWILGYIAFCLGTGHVSFCMCRKVRKLGGLSPFRIRHATYRFCVLITIVAVIIQIIFACLLYGVLPILAYFSDYDVHTLEASKQYSGFGQLGLLTLTLFIFNGLILIGIVSNFKAKGWNRKIFWMAVILAVFGSLFSGKSQSFFILVCVLVTGVALVRVNPINLLARKLGFREFSKTKTVVIMISFLFFLVLLHGFTRYVRSHAQKEFGVRYAFDSVVSYLSWPLMNMEKQIEISGLEGSQFEIWGFVQRLLPYKMQRHFIDQHHITTMPRVEATSPSGFLAVPHWYLGLWGMMIFLFAIGVVCKFLYVQSSRSLFCLLAYSQIAWTLVAAHTYNHFLVLLFIPAPIIVFFILSKIIKSKRVARKSIVVAT